MPVDLFFSEGGNNSPDVRVLRKVLGGACGEIRALGGKYGMGARILARRDVLKNSKVAGLLDGDFVSNWDGAHVAPRNWQSADGTICFGWRWSRKEIENYLVDPEVVAKSLGALSPGRRAYEDVLDNAAARICTYEAARTALSNCRRRFQDLPASWGRERGRGRHPFPDDFSDAACRDGICRLVLDHQAAQVVSTEEVTARFEALIGEFRDGGVRRRDYLWAFAGKDLLYSIEADLRPLGFDSAGAFRERILLGIERAEQDVAAWIPEWVALRDAVLAF